ncbi:glycosyl hydrolase [Sphingomonas sp. PP-CC-3A-396]|uniref:glycosyl hydrolase n=1 Tax=Sphingomonas sp. PP-CC-3A-396 TaxID=2135655 RepID=UPI001043DAFE|nr:glycosyl hydrolase [Sphingomonas sp. PP-CC-3A-396]TCQ02119.1 glycosyl hydrolase family 26 [Sphingomonas sp. PP-CC-3A-396]
MNVSIYNGAADERLTFLRAWEKWAGVKVSSVTVNGSTQAEWKEMISSIGWLVHCYLKNPDVNPVIGVSMLPRGSSHSIARYIAHWGDREARYYPFDRMMLEIVQLPKPVVRLGWEFNLKDWPWYAKTPAEFATLWRLIVDHTRKNIVGGHRVKWVWCPSITGWNKIDVAACYPGDDYVDVIAVDMYDMEEPQPGADAAARWALLRDCQFGLGWAARFARYHGKPLQISEVGAGKFGDNPYFVEQLAIFAKSNGCDLFWWENDNAYPGALMTGKRPKQAAAFRKMFR